VGAGFNVHISGRSIEKLEKKKQELEALDKNAVVRIK